MVSWGDLRRWDDAALHPAVGRLNSEAQKITETSDELRDAHSTGGWTGEAADAARAAADRCIDQIEETVAEATLVRQGIGDLADGVSGVRHAREETDHLAQANNFTIGDDGSVTDNGPPGAPGGPAGPVAPALPPEQAAAVAHARAIKKAEIEAHVLQVVRLANDLDNDFCAVMDRALSGHAIDATRNDNSRTDLTAAASAGAAAADGMMIPDPPGGSPAPAENALWWRTLTDAQRKRLIDMRPELVGPRDGIPARDRSPANMNLIAGQRTELQSAKADLQRQLDAVPRTAEGTVVPREARRFADLQAQMTAIDGKIAGLSTIENRVKNPGGGKPAFLLGVDPSGANGKAIIAIGDPDTARDVATYVPGTGSGLNAISGDMKRSIDMAEMAERQGSPSASVITWAGYDAPPEIPNAASPAWADGAEQKLHSFQQALQDTHQGTRPHTTVVGHSYGTTAIGHTARDLGLAADNLVFMGSPGVGVSNTDDLHLDGVPQDGIGERIYSSNAATDPVPWAANWGNSSIDPLGPDPANPAFGGQRFYSSPGWPWSSHSEYFDQDSPSLKKTGDIIAGS